MKLRIKLAKYLQSKFAELGICGPLYYTNKRTYSLRDIKGKKGTTEWKWLKAYNEVYFLEIYLDCEHPWYGNTVGFLKPNEYLEGPKDKIEKIRQWDSYEDCLQKNLDEWTNPNRLVTFMALEKNLTECIDTVTNLNNETSDADFASRAEEYREALLRFREINTEALTDLRALPNYTLQMHELQPIIDDFIDTPHWSNLQDEMEKGGFKFNTKGYRVCRGSVEYALADPNFQKCLLLIFGDPVALTDLKSHRELIAQAFVEYLKFCQRVYDTDALLHTQLVKFNARWLGKFVKTVENSLLKNKPTDPDIFMSCTYPKKHGLARLRINTDGSGKLILSYDDNEYIKQLASNLIEFLSVEMRDRMDHPTGNSVDAGDGNEATKKAAKAKNKYTTSFSYNYAQQNRMEKKNSKEHTVEGIAAALSEVEKNISKSEIIHYSSLIETINLLTSHNLDLIETQRILGTFPGFLKVEISQYKDLTTTYEKSFIKDIKKVEPNTNTTRDNPFKTPWKNAYTGYGIKQLQKRSAEGLLRTVVGKFNELPSNQHCEIMAFYSLLFLHSIEYYKPVIAESIEFNKILLKSQSRETHTIFYENNPTGVIPWEISLNYLKNKALTLKITVDLKTGFERENLDSVFKVDGMLADKTKEIANLVLENIGLNRVKTGRELFILTHIRVKQEDGSNITEYAVSESAPSQTEMTITNGIEWALSHKTKTTFIYKFTRRKQKKGCQNL